MNLQPPEKSTWALGTAISESAYRWSSCLRMWCGGGLGEEIAVLASLCTWHRPTPPCCAWGQ